LDRPNGRCPVPTPTPTGAGDTLPVKGWLASHTAIPEGPLDEYVAVFESEGATSMEFLADAEYARQDLIDLGVRVPHVNSILRAIEIFRGKDGASPGRVEVGGGLSSTGRSGSPRTIDPILADAVVGALRAVGGQSTPLAADHPLVTAVKACGVVVDNSRPLTTAAMVVASLQHISGSPAVTAAALRALKTLAREEVPRNELAELGACEALIAAMRPYVTDQQVALEGCWSVRNLAIDDVLAQRLARAGSCEMVVAAMRNFATVGAVQEQAAAAVVNLAGNNRDVKRIIAQAGACDTVLAAMRNFPYEADVLKQACWAILTLAVDDDNARALAAGGACELVVAAIRACPTDRVVLAKACAAIVNISGGQQELKRRMGQAGACEAVVTAMRAFPNDQPLQKQACWAIKNLVSRCHAILMPIESMAN
jgi:hypothetical protein